MRSGAVSMNSPVNDDETGAKVRRGGLCEAIKKPRAAKGGKGQMLQSLPAYGGRAAFFRAIPD